jgi:hypothetical protein
LADQLGLSHAVGGEDVTVGIDARNYYAATASLCRSRPRVSGSSRVAMAMIV